MQKHTPMTIKRLQTYQIEIKNRIYQKFQPLQLKHFAATGRIPYQEASQGRYEAIEVGTHLVPLWSTHWFKVEGQIPEAWEGLEVHLLWDSSSEATIWQEGQPVQGLTGSSNGWSENAIRSAFCITRQADAHQPVNFMIEAALNGLFGISRTEPRKNEGIGVLRQAELAVFDRELWNLYWDYVIIADMARYLPADSPRAGQALAAANAMINTILWDQPVSYALAREIAASFLAKINGEGQHQLSVIGHAHIDTAWLWPMAETKRKCIRTYSSTLRLMEDYPDYKFACSQAQQLMWIKTEQPGLYASIQKKVAEGQFIPVGATWVEPDTNIPNGESLVRQFLYGQQFFQQEFGKISTVFWEPDVFGYSAALPQIMKLSGVNFFLTQKLSWNEFNKHDRHSFIWEGLDGSAVLAHFPPVDTYNSLADVKDILVNVHNFKDHERANESYLLYGYGDGGGGPTSEMLEQLVRMKNVDGLPIVTQRSPEDFFERCDEDLKDPTTWVGELYFENHRGTFTTQAALKQGNRRCEEMLHDLEFLASLAHMLRGVEYPAQTLKTLWQALLTNQFHDILPGSSIRIVNQEARTSFENIASQAEVLRNQAIHSLLSQADDFSLINTLGCRRLEVVMNPQNESLEGQLVVVDMPAFAVRQLKDAIIDEFRSVSVVQSSSSVVLENEFIRVKINPEGQLVSLLEKASGRECMDKNMTANQFILYEDIPAEYDAWNVDVYYDEKVLQYPIASTVKLIENNPLRVKVEFEMPVGKKSHLWQIVSLTAISAQVEFETRVDWQEEHAFLRVNFPLNLRANFATYETQFGLLQRSTRRNTSFELAQFEVPAQRWADLSEPDFGVALLNNGKYGYACQGSVLSLSLLRAPKEPDPEADMGEHQFKYALLPHALSPQLSAVWWHAACFNQPLIITQGNTMKTDLYLASVDAPNIILDTFKLAEDGDGFICRLYETAGSHTHATLNLKQDFASAEICDLLERSLGIVAMNNSRIPFDFQPFQIISLRLRVA